MSDAFESQRFHNDLIYDSFVDQKRSKSPKTLTKSKFLNGLQCPKLLWTRCNDPEKIPPPDDSLQQIFDIGHRVGILATTRFSGGVHVQEDDFAKNLAETRVLLSSSKPCPIYEAGVMAGRLYARADILRPSAKRKGAWDVIEVKCGTSCKDVYLQDIAFQKYCYEQAGLIIDRCFLMHVNSDYVRQGEINVEEFFTLLDVSAEIMPFFGQVPKYVEEFLKIIDMPSCPQISIREYCSDPYDCSMKSLCWAFLPKGNVLELRGKKAKGFDLLEKGVTLLKDIPDNVKLSDTQAIQRQCAINRDAYIDHDTVAAFLKGLKYPLYFMDFETTFEVLPRFDGLSPYQQLPFQFSVHVQMAPGRALEHRPFLHKSLSDPRRPFLEALHQAIGPEGDIVVYNKTFEDSHVLKKMAPDFPEHEAWINDIRLRMADLLDPFRSFAYYHPNQAGSASIKKVLPVLVGTSYEGMDIAEGGAASSEYIRVTFNDRIDPADKAHVYAALETYCALDTKAMVDIIEALKRIQKG